MGKGSGSAVIRPATRLFLHTAAVIVAAGAVVFAAAAWRLASGPIPLTFLTPYVRDALRDTDSPYRVEFDDTILAWAGWDRTLDIRLLGVRAVGSDGALAATAPEVSIALSVPALVRGMIAPTSLEIIKPRVLVVREAEGRIELGLGDVADAQSGPAELLLADLLAPPDPSRAMGYLTRVSVVDADVTFADRRLGTSWHAPRATVSFTRDGAGIGAVATLDLEVGEGVTRLDVRARYNSADGGTDVIVGFADVRPEWFAHATPGLAFLGAVRVPVSGRLEARVDADASLSRVDFELSAGAGTLVADDWFDDSLKIAFARAKGSVTPGIERVRLDEVYVDLGGPTLAGQGVVEGFGRAPHIAAGVTLSDLPVNELGRYWPPGFIAEAREWILANLSEGVIRKAQSSIRLRPGDLSGPGLPEEAMTTTFEVEGVTVDYLHPLPKVVGVNATGTLTGKALTLGMSGGRLKGLVVGPASLRIDDIGGRDLTTIDVTVRGPIRDALEVLASPPFDYFRKLGVDPAAVDGVAATRLYVAFPILKDLSLDAITVRASSALRDVSLGRPLDGYNLSHGTLSLALDREGMDVAGPLSLNAVPAVVTWRENFTDDAPFRRRFTMNGRFTDSERLGIGFPGNEYVAGPTDIDVEIVDFDDGLRQWRVTAGLRDATVRLPALHWRKDPGTDGILQVEARTAPGKTVVIDAIEFAAGDLAISGRAELEPGGGALRRLVLNRLDFGETNVAADIAPRDGGGFTVRLSGASLDLTPYLENGGDETMPPLDVSARLDRVLIREGHVLSGVKAALRSRDGRWEMIAAEGALAGGNRLVLRLGRTNAGRMLRLTADDAGAVLRAFNLFDNMAGGKLTLTAALDRPDGAVVGELRVDDYTLVEAPLLAKLLSVASITGVIELLKGKGLPFRRLVFPFTKRADSFDIEDARAFGPAMGFTLEGRVDLAADSVELNGTLVPAYTLNSVLGKLPLLGNILVGEKGGGVFAVTYRVSGPLDNPEIRVNPLSALAPGVLRGLFTPDADGADDEAPDFREDASR